MPATIIDGKAIAAEVRAEVAADVEAFVGRHGRAPGLATVLIGEDPASAVYVGGKQRACTEVGIRGFDHRPAADITRTEIGDLLASLNADPAVSGVLCQLPVPAHLDGVELTNLITPEKDVDGLTVSSAGRLALGLFGLVSCTPAGVLRLLDATGVALEGREAVVIGRSNLFGKPMAQLLLGRNATVTVAHSRTADLAAVARRADVLIVAVGRARMVRGDWIKPGATVVDVGMNRLEDVLYGDVDADEAAAVAGFLTPVPGGVGPMTIAQLLANTVKAARLQVSDPV